MKSTHQFIKVNQTETPSLDGAITEYLHQSTRLRVFIFSNKDKHRGFEICVRTPAQNNKGTTHVLEHCALMGSESYPVKDPFFTMLQSSPSTFMNAATGADSTYYPASSQVTKDFDNLLSLYLDAVINPLLRKHSFMRDGYRLQIHENNGQWKLSNSGVVYNEMHTVQDHPDVAAYYAARRSLFTKSTYAYQSGGIPADIAMLTHQDITEYHQQYYCPANMAISLSGDIDAEKYLTAIERYLDKESGKSYHYRPEQSISNRKHTVFSQGDAQKSIGIVSFLGPQVHNFDDILDWQFLELVLFENDFSVGNKLIHEMNLEPWVYNGIDTAGTQTVAMIGATSMQKEQTALLYEQIMGTLDQFEFEAEGGIVERICKKLAINSKSHLQPTDITRVINNAWVWGLDPSAELEVDPALDRLAQRMNEEGYLEALVGQLFTKNQQYTETYLQPQGDYQQRRHKLLTKQLEKQLQAMSEDEIARLKRENADFEQFNRTPDTPVDLAKLPRITPKDIDTEYTTVPEDVLGLERGQLLLHVQPTRGLVHINAIVDISQLEPKLIPYLNLYTDLVGRIGVAGSSSEEMVNRIETEIAQPIDAEVLLKSSADGSQGYVFLSISGTCLPEDTAKLKAIIDEYLYQIDFSDSKQVKLALAEAFQTTLSDAVFYGHETAMYSGLARIDGIGEYASLLNGMQYYQKVADLYNDIGELEALQSGLSQITEHVRSQDAWYAVTAQQADQEAVLSQMNATRKTNLQPATGIKLAGADTSQPTVWITDTNVAYNTYTLSAPSLDDTDWAPTRILASILRDKYLLPKLREQGGAYGAGTRYSAVFKTLTLSSARDPRISGSYEVFQGTRTWLDKQSTIDKQAISNAMCKLMGIIDAPESPAEASLNQSLRSITGITDSLLRKQRQRVLQVSPDQVTAQGQKLFSQKPIACTTISGAETLERERNLIRQALPGLETIRV